MLKAGEVDEGRERFLRLPCLVGLACACIPLRMGDSLPSEALHASLWTSSSRFFFRWLGRVCCPPVPRGPSPAVCSWGFQTLSESLVFRANYGTTLSHFVTQPLTLLSLWDLFTCPPAALKGYSWKLKPVCPLGAHLAPSQVALDLGI